MKHATKAEIEDYKRIRQYVLSDRRQIKQTGEREFFVNLSQSTEKFTQEELDRSAATERNRAGRGSRTPTLQSDYTDIRRAHVSRCSIFGCGGAVINGTSVQRAIQPHFNHYSPRHRAARIMCTFEMQVFAREWA